MVCAHGTRAGISTPISFELVQAGNRQGVINEHISGKTRTELPAEEPEKAEEMDGILAEIGRALQHAPAAETTMPVQATQMLWFERTFGNRFAGYSEKVRQEIASAFAMKWEEEPCRKS